MTQTISRARLGQFVLYTLTDEDAAQITAPSRHRGGDVLPALVVHVDAADPTSLNLRAIPDGDGDLFVTDRRAGTGPGTWHRPSSAND